MLMIQATTISGRLIEAAKWEAEYVPGLSVGQVMQVNIPLVDKQLIKAIQKMKGSLLETEEEGEYSVTVGLMIEKFTHMLELNIDMSKKNIDSMVWVKPVDRTVESILLYLMDPDFDNKRFLALMKSNA